MNIIPLHSLCWKRQILYSTFNSRFSLRYLLITDLKLPKSRSSSMRTYIYMYVCLHFRESPVLITKQLYKLHHFKDTSKSHHILNRIHYTQSCPSRTSHHSIPGNPTKSHGTNNASSGCNPYCLAVQQTRYGSSTAGEPSSSHQRPLLFKRTCSRT